MKRSADIDTILNVLRLASMMKLPLVAAVAEYRSTLRDSMRSARRDMRTYSDRPRMAEFAVKRLKRLQAESARVRRLQRTYPSWRGDTSLVGLVLWHQQALETCRNAERYNRSAAYINRCYKLVWQAEDAMRRAGI